MGKYALSVFSGCLLFLALDVQLPILKIIMAIAIALCIVLPPLEDEDISDLLYIRNKIMSVFQELIIAVIACVCARFCWTIVPGLVIIYLKVLVYGLAFSGLMIGARYFHRWLNNKIR